MSEVTIKEVKQRLENCIDLYVDFFCQKQEVWFDGWVADDKGGIGCFSDSYLSFDDIRLDLEMNAPKGEIFNWYWGNVENEQTINYYSYIKGLRTAD